MGATQVGAVAFSRSQMLAICADDGTVELRDFLGELCGRILRGEGVCVCGFAPDGLGLVVGDAQGKVAMYDERGGIVWEDDRGAAVSCVALARDGASLVAGGRDRCAVGYDVATGAMAAASSWGDARAPTPDATEADVEDVSGK